MALGDTEPQMVAIPAHPGANDQLIFEARRQPGGTVLPVFSSVRVLIEALGHSQPWAVVPLEKVTQLAPGLGIDLVALDPDVADDAWRWEPADLGGFSWKVNT